MNVGPSSLERPVAMLMSPYMVSALLASGAATARLPGHMDLDASWERLAAVVLPGPRSKMVVVVVVRSRLDDDDE